MISSEDIFPIGLHEAKTSQYLTYHEISNTDPDYRYSISLAKFVEHARCLRRLTDSGRSERVRWWLYARPSHPQSVIKSVGLMTAVGVG